MVLNYPFKKKSKTLESITYDSKSHVLSVFGKDGSILDYPNVSKIMYEQFTDSNSFDTWYLRNLKNKPHTVRRKGNSYAYTEPDTVERGNF